MSHTPNPKIKITKEFKAAFEQMETRPEHVFLTGRAGTGKSTLLGYFRQHTKKKHVVLAPTGVAALNVKGQTIHSFFGFHPHIDPKRVRKADPEKLDLFKSLDTVVIDEISMVRADLLDCVDRALRLNRERMDEPFGGVQMILIGDLYQLPPVVTRQEEHHFSSVYASPYFFSAFALAHAHVVTIELTTVHRQREASFVTLLNNIRAGEVTPEDIATWNERHDPTFDPEDTEEHVVHLTTTNKLAQQRNTYELKRLSSKEWTFKASSNGSLGTRKMPSEATLKLKEGAHVMFTTNDQARKWVNGTLGTVKKIKKQGFEKFPTITVELADGTEVDVRQHTWEIFSYTYQHGSFEEETAGTYTQYPLTLAWAVTIHKAQGKTFDQVLVDMGWGAFAHGQLYVALSRCTTFDGIILRQPFKPSDVIVDQAVLDFMKED